MVDVFDGLEAVANMRVSSLFGASLDFCLPLHSNTSRQLRLHFNQMSNRHVAEPEEDSHDDRPDDTPLTLLHFLSHPKTHRYTFLAIVATAIVFANIDSLRTAWRPLFRGFASPST